MQQTQPVLRMVDYQANLGLDLGYQGSAGDDDGLGLAQALAYGVRPGIPKDVRPNLDVIVGGGHVDGAAAALARRTYSGEGVRIERGHEWLIARLRRRRRGPERDP